MARLGTTTPSRRMSLMGHIQEIQRRLVFSALFLIVASTTAYAFKDPILAILIKPLDGQKLMYLNPAGGFSFILMVSIYAGIACSAPFFIHQLYRFVRPALPQNVQRKSVQILVFSSLLLVAGILFGYFFAIPGALQFLKEFAGDIVSASLTADSYLQFIAAYMLGLGLVFQLPLLLMLIHWIKPLTPGGLMKSERWIIILSFVAAAIITPTPDPLNQIIIALPIIVIYQLGVFAVLINIYRSKRKDRLVKQRQRPVAAASQSVLQAMPLAPRPVLAIDTAAPRLHTSSTPTTSPLRLRSMDGVRVHPKTRRAPLVLPTSSTNQTALLKKPSDNIQSVERPTIRRHAPRFAIDGISPSFQLSR